MKSSSIYKLKEVLKTLSNDENKIQKAVWELEDILKEDRKYNGWINYETWAVNLWLTNDEGLYNMAMECDSVQSLKDLVENLADPQNEEGLQVLSFIEDLKNASLSECDFYDLFEAFEQTRKENEAYEKAEAIQ